MAKHQKVPKRVVAATIAARLEKMVQGHPRHRALDDGAGARNRAVHELCCVADDLGLLETVNDILVALGYHAIVSYDGASDSPPIITPN